MFKNKIILNDKIDLKSIQNISDEINGALTSEGDEHAIEFDNDFGKGTIKVALFNEGLSLLSFDVKFSSDMWLDTCYEDPVPIHFLFLTSGRLKFKTDNKQNLFIESYQNAIIRNKSNAEVSFKILAGDHVQLCFIQIYPDVYIKKLKRKCDGLPSEIRKIFTDTNSSSTFHHFGNFNLKIADYIRQLNNCSFDGIIRQLTFEGTVSLILGLQLSEYTNYYQNLKLPESLTKEDIIKIQNATEYIREHIHDSISVNDLAYKVQITPSKLQLGFKLLYQKTVNNYVKELKLQAAYNYLSNTNLTVSEVVYKVGYNSRSYFTQIFFERFGILPSDYVKNKN